MMTDDPLINQQLDEYLIETLLGKGGMARVYRGVDVNLKRYVAIKVIDTPYQSDSDYTMRFEREAQVIAQLSHPNVVQLYRYGKVENFLYMVMQYIQGADLHTILSGYRQDREFMQPDEVRQVTGDVCRALDYVHGQGVIHRDVKPSNILLTQDGRAILSDFGLALLTEIGTLGRIFGSPQYIAPEQAISSARAEARSDLYSLGVILYEIFTGRLPFAAKDPLELAMQHVSNEPPRPSQVRPQISEQIEDFLLKALAKKPEERYPDGAALYAALDQALASAEEAAAALPATLTHLTIPERVKIQTDSEPLPEIKDEGIGERGKGIEADIDAGAVEGKRASEGPNTQPYNPAQRARLGLKEAKTTGDGTAFPADLPPEGVPSTKDREPAGSGRRRPLLIGAAGLVMLLVMIACVGGGLWAGTRLVGGVLIPRWQAVFAPGATQEVQITIPVVPPTSTQEAQITRPVVPPTLPADTATPATGPAANVQLWMEGDNSLFVVNQGPGDLPLAPLQLGNTPSKVLGEEWGVDRLLPGQCVAVWKDYGKSKAPKGLECEELGEHLERPGKDRFWTASFNVYYQGEFVGSCKSKDSVCDVQILAGQ
jgi:serine/threonine protein kinase